MESIAAQLLKEHRGQHVGLLAPLVVNRKGVYTDLAKWAKARGHTHLRVDGEFIKVDPWPRLDRFKEHTLELPVADLVVSAANEAALREALAKALGSPGGMRWLDCEVTKSEAGVPSFVATGTVAARIAELGIASIHLSISHDGGYATALVVCES